jgi:hypothetical protein
MPSYDLSLQDQTGVEEAQLQRRMQLAQLLSQGATQGPAYSNKAAVAKVLTQVLGGMDMRSAEQDERNLAQKRTADRQAEIGQIFDAAQGGDAKRGELARLLARSKDPSLSQVGLSMVLKPDKEEEPYTLKPGEIRYGRGGKVLAQAPDKQEPYTLGPDQSRYDANGNLVVAAGEKEPEAVRAIRIEMEAAGIDPKSPIGKGIFQKALEKSTTHPPATSVTVDTGAKPMATRIGEALGGDFAAARQAAMGAQKGLQVADEAEKILNSGAYTGAGGNFQLVGGKIAQAAGFATDKEKIANTEALVSNLAQQTLANIKQSGLGGGNGFSNADREFLQNATGGKIEMTELGLRKLVDLNRRSNANVIRTFDSMASELEKRPEYKGMPLRLGIQQGQGRSREDILGQYGVKD